jgi:hypothetical protein
LVANLQVLQPDPNSEIVTLLAQISAQLNGTTAPAIPAPFKPPTSSIRVNILWFTSLCLSLAVALTAVMVQTWCRRYTQLAQRPQLEPGLQGRIRVFLFHGIERYRMEDLVGVIPAFLHIAVLLFMAGLVEFLFPINLTVASVTLAVVVAFAICLISLTVSPLIVLESPYSTPLSWILWRIVGFIDSIIHLERPALPTSGAGDWRAISALKTRKFQLGPRHSIEHSISQRSVDPSEIRALLRVVGSTPMSPDDTKAFCDGLSLAINTSPAHFTKKMADVVIIAGHGFMLSAARRLFPHGGPLHGLRSWLRLFFAIHKASGRPVLRDTLAPLYVRPVMTPALEHALAQIQWPSPNITARVLLAYIAQDMLSWAYAGVVSDYGRVVDALAPLAPPEHPLCTMRGTQEEIVIRFGGAVTILSLVEDGLVVFRRSAELRDSIASVNMVADFVQGMLDDPSIPDMSFSAHPPATALVDVFWRIHADLTRLVFENTYHGSSIYTELLNQMERLRARLRIDVVSSPVPADAVDPHPHATAP